MRQEPFEILVLVLPCGQGNFPGIGRLEGVLSEFFQTAACFASFGFAWFSTASRSISPPSGNTSPLRKLRDSSTQILRWLVMDRNGLGGFSYSRANKQFTRPCRHVIDASWLLSSCLIVCSSRSVRTCTKMQQA